MKKINFIEDFICLGKEIKEDLRTCNNDLEIIINEAYSENPFFTPIMQKKSLLTICDTFLKEEELKRWLNKYPKEKSKNNVVGIIMAGNIPLVGFHDFLCVMALEMNAIVKLSSKDKILMPYIVDKLVSINDGWSKKINFTNSLPDNSKINILISTGSNSTALFMKERYKNIPKLIRGRRFSFAILSGQESSKDLKNLAEDVFLYYGLGCRSINYLFVPKGYDFSLLINIFKQEQTLCKNDCYMNIFKQRRALLILQDDDFIDGGFFLLVKDMQEDMYPPIGEIRYREYDSVDEIISFEDRNKDQIQKKYRTFGTAQAPLIDEYADNIDTVQFILDNVVSY